MGFCDKMCIFAQQTEIKVMTGPQLLIAAIVIALVIAFIITMLVVNSNAKKIIDTNTRLVENQNLLVELNKQQDRCDFKFICKRLGQRRRNSRG